MKSNAPLCFSFDRKEIKIEITPELITRLEQAFELSLLQLVELFIINKKGTLKDYSLFIKKLLPSFHKTEDKAIEHALLESGIESILLFLNDFFERIFLGNNCSLSVRKENNIPDFHPLQKLFPDHSFCHKGESS